jgi:hypothetical protein
MAVEMGVIGSPVMGWGVEIAAGDVEMLHGGATVDWATVPALGADVTLPDGTVAKAGEQWLFPGQVLMEITSGGSIRMMGPYDPADTTTGRGTVAVGVRCGLVRKAVHYRPDHSQRFYDSMIGLIVAGPVKRGMVRATTGTHSLANGPTWTELLTMLPRLVPVSNLRGAHT